MLPSNCLDPFPWSSPSSTVLPNQTTPFFQTSPSSSPSYPPYPPQFSCSATLTFVNIRSDSNNPKTLFSTVKLLKPCDNTLSSITVDKCNSFLSFFQSKIVTIYSQLNNPPRHLVSPLELLPIMTNMKSSTSAWIPYHPPSSNSVSQQSPHSLVPSSTPPSPLAKSSKPWNWLLSPPSSKNPAWILTPSQIFVLSQTSLFCQKFWNALSSHKSKPTSALMNFMNHLEIGRASCRERV